MNRADTLKAALSAVQERNQSYGLPENNFLRIARRWNVHLLNRYGAKVELDSADVAAMMADMKLARIEQSPSHQDSWTDLAGYAACGAEVSVTPKRPTTLHEAVDAALAARYPTATILPVEPDEVLDDGRRV